MTDRLEPVESLLLDHHLKRLDPQRESRVNEALAHSPELAAQSRGLGEVLGLLDRHDASEPPADLADSVLARIDAQTAVLPFRAPSSAVPAGTAHDLSASPVLSLRELIAIAACITLFVGIFVPGYYKTQSIAKRNRCLDNQRQIWAGMASFAESNDGRIAHAQFVPGGSWLPTRVPNVRRVSNTAYVFKLVSQGHVRDTLVFICPAAPRARPMLADDYGKFDDFAEPANNTYSYMFNNVPKPRRLADLSNGANRQLVLVGDRNPLFDSRWTPQPSLYEEHGINSPSHDGGAGQNAIYVAGHGGWFTQPTIGVDKDNIYQAGKLVHYQGTETPTSPTDTLLVP